MRLLLACLLLCGCAGCSSLAALPDPEPFITPPHLTRVTLDVSWHGYDELARLAGSPSLGIGEIGLAEGQVVRLWLPIPTGFNTLDSCVAGHELYHALGATHKRKGEP